MANSTPNQLDRSRPSSRLQPQNLLETTPILFRLPSVPSHPLPLVEDLPPAAFQQAQADVPTPMPTAPVTPAVSIDSKPTVTTEDKQSWWEHWSSGIVLVVLLVALYMTSILVIKSRSQKPSDTMADEKTETGDLANIEVPQIEIVAGGAGEAVENATTELTLPTLTLENSAETKARAEELVGSISNALDTTVGQAVPSKMEPATGDDRNSRAGNSLTSAPSTPLATAQLLEPTQMPTALPLLPDSTTRSSSVQAQPVSSEIGQSPSLYDGANNSLERNTTLAATNSGMTPGSDDGQSASSSLQVVKTDTQPAPTQTNYASSGSTLPDYSQATATGASIPNFVSGTNQKFPVASTASIQQPAAPNAGGSSGGIASGGTTPRLTSTPDANGEVEAIIKAYLELMRAGRATESTQQPTTTAPTNRYQPTR
jgi:hypothetical protein